MNLAHRVAIGLIFSVTSGLAQSKDCRENPPTELVSAVYPTAEVLPENLLRFYVYFEQPMNTANALSHVYLTDASGTQLDGVFIENKVDLWSPDRTRLTLLFDPGRVKTGLIAHNTLGRALEAGETYHLVVEAGDMSASGCASTFVKTFSVSKAHFIRPVVSDWTISSPPSGTTMPITMGFPSPIDHTSLAFRIRIKDSRGQSVPGAIDVRAHESQWVFSPNSSWQASESYSVFVDPILEDIVGNRPTGLFDQPSLIDSSLGQNQLIQIPIKLSED
ncbi:MULTISPECIES: Ig-like domain-containing protein [unclassified Vibrio]|uniref:Ig-like domain-containing protein n=1 Tax=unclassified Vibrio TaxID=2614977 RepID=UPI001267BF9F|nr:MULTISPECIES: Ig-like domain-containing protein [unclassified Vibrio]QFT39789.1 hypothetical protein FIU99_25725 [Vibrio sp. THAF64]QGM37704.1 hypothetical protein GGC04_25755 [Vibrio sp. THAF191d]QGN73047.1 hypothetical protein GGC03_24980 [Vibrio sp. THAF191c]